MAASRHESNIRNVGVLHTSIEMPAQDPGVAQPRTERPASGTQARALQSQQPDQADQIRTSKGEKGKSNPEGGDNAGESRGKDQGDPSEAVFSIYVERAEEYDKALVESWSADMDSILIFVSHNCTYHIKRVTYQSCPPGWFILCCRNGFYHRKLQGAAARPK